MLVSSLLSVLLLGGASLAVDQAPQPVSLELPARNQFVGPHAPLVLADKPLVLGLVRVIEPPATAMPVAIVALDGTTLEERWRATGVGDGAIDLVHVYTHLGRVGDTVVVAQANRVVRGLDLADGSERWKLPLSDVPRTMCILDGYAYVEILDETRVKVAALDGTSSPIEAIPDGCAVEGQPGPVGPDGRPRSVMRRSEVEDVPLRAGFAWDARLSLEGETDGIALLHKAPGTSVPHVAYWKGDGIGWRRALDTADRFAAEPRAPDVVAMNAQVAVIAYRRRMGQSRLQAIDRRTGRPLWDIAPPHPEHDIDTLRLGDEHVYVGHWTFLEAIELSTGKASGSYGIW